MTSVTPVASVGLPTPGAQAQPLTAANTQAAAGNAAIGTSYSSTPVSGGGFQDTVTDAVTSLTSFAQTKMAEAETRITALTNSEGEMDAAKLQLEVRKMTMYEQGMTIAAKIEEKRERAIDVWLRPS
jgi:hypothetical protein